MDEKLREYREAFGEQFPLMLVQGVSDDGIAAIIDECLEVGRPYEPECEDGIKY